MSLEKIIIEYSADLKEIRAELATLKSQISGVDETAKASAQKTEDSLNKVGTNVSGKLTGAFKTLGLAIAGAFTIRAIGNFISSTLELATAAEEVKTAFNKLNDPGLLSRLRNAVNGTLSDVKLMQIAIKANNFKIPLQDLAKLFEFAKIKADETGRSVEDLANTIVESVGRNSTRALVDLGISQKDISEKVKETGSLYEGMVAIIDKGLREAGKDIDSAADKQERLKASIEDTKVELGKKFLPLMATFLDGLNFTIEQIQGLFDKTKEKEKEASAATIKLYQEHGAEIRDQAQKNVDKFTSSVGDITKISTDNLNKAWNEEKQKLQEIADTMSENAPASWNIMAQAAKDSIAVIDDYIKKEFLRREALKQTTDETDKHKNSVEDNIKSLDDYLNTLDRVEGIHVVYADDLQVLIAKYGDLIAQLHSYAELERGPGRSARRGAINDLEQMQGATEKAQISFEQWGESFLSVVGSVNEAYSAGSDYRLSLLQNELDQGIISQEQFDRESRALKRREAIREKAYSSFSIILSTARAIMAALALVPPNPGLAVLAGVTGAAELGVVVGSPIPAFAKGRVGINGPGTETSDSIIARLSKGETITTARQTKKYRPLLEAIHKDTVEKYLMNVYLKDKKNVVNEADYRLLMAIKEGTYQSKVNNSVLVDTLSTFRKKHRFQA